MGVTDLRQTTTGDQPGDARPPSWSRRSLVAWVLLGGAGGFVDGIVLHQILRWHHMLTATGDHPADSVAGLESNTLADGLFHAATWLFVVAGIVVLRRAWAAGRPAPTVAAQLGGVLARWGSFNLVKDCPVRAVPYSRFSAGLAHIFPTCRAPHGSYRAPPGAL